MSLVVIITRTRLLRSLTHSHTCTHTHTHTPPYPQMRQPHSLRYNQRQNTLQAVPDINSRSLSISRLHDLCLSLSHALFVLFIFVRLSYTFQFLFLFRIDGRQVSLSFSISGTQFQFCSLYHCLRSLFCFSLYHFNSL